jgi:type IV pilus assembly protein PilB
MVARANHPARRTVEEIFLEQGLLKPDTLHKVRAEVNRLEKPFQQVAVDMKIVDKMDALRALAKEWRQKAVNLDDLEIDPDIIRILPENLCRRNDLLPFAREDGMLLVAMADPRDLLLTEDLHLRTGCEVRCYLALPDDIHRELNRVYINSHRGLMTDDDLRGAAALKSREMMENLSGYGMEEVAKLQDRKDLLEVDAGAPEVERIVNAIILSALEMKASDIHIEPFEDIAGLESRVVVRFRVDGFLKESPFKIPWTYRQAIVAKIKIMSNSMNITERRIPQSGRIQVMAKGRPIEFRLESVPTVYGESVSLRLLDRKAVQVDIHKLGFLPDTLERLLDQLKGVGGKKNYGIVLVTGPTGSGKTTTLYAALNHINNPNIRILTAENPVEYNIDGIIQVPVNPEIHLGKDKCFDFATALRSFLRLDPDVVMVGEIRDHETAKIAMEAAMTGHLVFSTLHTNDAPATLARLTEMGIPAYLVASTVKCVLSQRLCRVLCPTCKTLADLNPAEKAVFKAHHVPVPAGTKLYVPVGCGACGGVGYKGRCGIHELLIMDDVVREAALENGSSQALRAKAMNESPQKMRAVVQDGLMKVLEGTTTVSEVLGEMASLVAEKP